MLGGGVGSPFTTISPQRVMFHDDARVFAIINDAIQEPHDEFLIYDYGEPVKSCSIFPQVT